MVEQETTGAAAETPEDRLRAWRRTHPAARLDEILDEVEGELGRLRQRYLDVVLGEEPATPNPPEAACPRCGNRLEQHGRRREVLVPHQATPAGSPLAGRERAYRVCSSCGTSLFPPR